MKKGKYSKPYQSEKIIIEFTGNLATIGEWLTKKLMANVNEKYHDIKKENYNLFFKDIVMHIQIK